MSFLSTKRSRMVLLKMNKWVVFVALSLLAMHPCLILSSSSQDSSNKTPTSNMAPQGSGNPGSGQTGGLGFPACGCRYSPNGNWALNWGLGSGPRSSTFRFGSGAGQSPNGGGFGFGWSSSTSSGDGNSPSIVGGGGGGSGSVNFQFGFGGGFGTSNGNTRYEDVRTKNNMKNIHGRDGSS